ncbi:hypothetical protein [Streptomyces youssoufiensis]
MADTTDPDPPGSTAEGAPAPATRRRARLSLARWLLAPRTTWRARRLAAETGMDAQRAWALTRVRRHPEEWPMARENLVSLDQSDQQRDLKE